MAEFGRVEVKSIKTQIPRSTYSEVELDMLADQILQNDGALRPVIVKRIDYENFQLLDGTLTYFASVRAYEKDARRGEMVNAFIVGIKEDESLVIEQLAAFDRTHDGQTKPVGATGERADREALSAWITSFETRLTETRQEAVTKLRDLESRLRQVEKVTHNPMGDLLDLINSLTDDALFARLLFYGANKLKAEAICQARKQKENGQFVDYEDLLRNTKGLGTPGLLSLINNARIHHRS